MIPKNELVPNMKRMANESNHQEVCRRIECLAQTVQTSEYLLTERIKLVQCELRIINELLYVLKTDMQKMRKSKTS